MESYRYIHAKSSWMSARDALELAEKLAEMGAEDGNIDSYMRQGVYNDYLIEKGEPEFGTSDFIATVPMLYMVTNGIELLLKGHLYAAHPDQAPKEPPKLKNLLRRFREDFPDEKALLDFITTYTEEKNLPELFASFLAENDMSLMSLYDERRFLNNSSFYNIIDRYKPYIYTWEQGRVFYQEVLGDVRVVIPIIEELQADINSDGVPGEKVKALRH